MVTDEAKYPQNGISQRFADINKLFGLGNNMADRKEYPQIDVWDRFADNRGARKVKDLRPESGILL